MIKKGSRHEYIARTNDISYPKNIEDYLEEEYPKNPDLFTDEIFQQLVKIIDTLSLIGALDGQEPKDIVAGAMKNAKQENLG